MTERTYEGSVDAEVETRARLRAQNLILTELTRGPKTREELAKKLAAQGIGEQDAQAALTHCTAVGLVDDAQYATLWVRSRSRSKGLSWAALHRELCAKGIPPHIVDDALEGLEDSDRERARTLVTTKLPRDADWSQPHERVKHQRKLLNVLIRKGYSYDLAHEIVSTHTPSGGSV